MEGETTVNSDPYVLCKRRMQLQQEIFLREETVNLLFIFIFILFIASLNK